ncbi:transposase family protein [Pseudonocardia sp. ICBG1293]|uniref:transposase family protein n=1 Tax=Pseudonocardia sp. ICBG1293 TaxID=2844382 RepID=UPI001CCDDC86|nr:transposase family protein [Pseudonocardia sp. ICBG1293]
MVATVGGISQDHQKNLWGLVEGILSEVQSASRELCYSDWSHKETESAAELCRYAGRDTLQWMASGYDRGFYSGKHKCHGLNVPVIADPAGRLVWISPPLPGARHDMGASREHGIIDALTEHRIPAAADTAYQGSGPTVAVPQRRRRLDPDSGRMRPLSQAQKDVNAAHARRRGPGERVNAELKNWKTLRKIRSSPNRAGQLIAAVQTLMIANT